MQYLLEMFGLLVCLGFGFCCRESSMANSASQQRPCLKVSNFSNLRGYIHFPKKGYILNNINMLHMNILLSIKVGWKVVCDGELQIISPGGPIAPITRDQLNAVDAPMLSRNPVLPLSLQKCK
jgi:hypothetical protein